MDPKTDELRAAHDVLSGFYRERLAGALDHMPEDRAVLGLFCELVDVGRTRHPEQRHAGQPTSKIFILRD